MRQAVRWSGTGKLGASVCGTFANRPYEAMEVLDGSRAQRGRVVRVHTRNVNYKG
jgi:hypothetical protein